LCRPCHKYIHAEKTKKTWNEVRPQLFAGFENDVKWDNFLEIGPLPRSWRKAGLHGESAAEMALLLCRNATPPVCGRNAPKPTTWLALTAACFFLDVVLKIVAHVIAKETERQNHQYRQNCHTRAAAAA